ncbi:unnamed protein product [Gongylonema pulchrum]|uniref:WH2 domain-containing protein n=1 Tax=Gongylonema pulchrum TaxID=637853 RepID=A0A183DT99_9BILA|nr:unnamed protein product [Gongylonema pulchrum]
MADPELAGKLEKRLAKLSAHEPPDPKSPSHASSIPVPPPPPPQKEQTPPMRVIPDDEITDMDKLIGQTLRARQVTSQKAPAGLSAWMDYRPETCKKESAVAQNRTFEKPAEDPAPVATAADHLDNNRKANSPPKCSPPVVTIVHHKNSRGELRKQFSCDEYMLQKKGLPFAKSDTSVFSFYRHMRAWIYMCWNTTDLTLWQFLARSNIDKHIRLS